MSIDQSDIDRLMDKLSASSPSAGTPGVGGGPGANAGSNGGAEPGDRANNRAKPTWLGRLPRISFNAPVIIGFTALSFVAMLAGQLTGGVATRLLFCTYPGSLLDPLTYVRMFTHVLGHADYSHWLGNFLLILVVGPSLEQRYGSRRLLGLIALTAFVIALLNNLLFRNALLGASGVAFMMILLASFAGREEGTVPLTLILVAALWLGGEVVDAFTADNVSQFAHIMGGAVGCAAGFALERPGKTARKG